MTKRQTIQWPKDRQYNGQKNEEQTIQWPKDRQYNDPKDRQYNGQKTDNTMTKRQTIQ